MQKEAAPEHKTDRESRRVYAAPEHKADRGSKKLYAAPEHKEDRESMLKPVSCPQTVAGCRQLTCCRQYGDSTGAGGKEEFVTEIEAFVTEKFGSIIFCPLFFTFGIPGRLLPQRRF